VIASTGIALAAAGSALPRGVAAICGLCSGSLRYSDMPIPVDRIGNERENLTRSPAAALRLCANTGRSGETYRDHCAYVIHSCDCDAGIIAR
jgi:hypothetical protein